jgi:acyl-CoA reductase-like NAD-dependent aldehyde dehydrogenase
VCEASEKDTDDAVAAAKAAFPAWSALSPAQRGTYMKKLAGLIRENRKEMAWLEAMSMGNPVRDYWHADVAAGHFEHYSEVGYDSQGTTSLNTPGFVNMTFRQPYGVASLGNKSLAVRAADGV